MNLFKNFLKSNKKGQAPENLPFKEASSDFETATPITQTSVSSDIPKSQMKTLVTGLIVVLIVIVSAPRIISNVTSTYSVVEKGAEKFPILFPALSSTGSNVGGFIGNGLSGIAGFFTGNLATVADIFYSGSDNEMIGGEEDEEKAQPVRIIVEKVGIDSVIANPESTDISVLEEALKQGVVRYPKSGLLGEKDNVYIFGHSTSLSVVRNPAYKALNGLKDLQEGDLIKIQSQTREYVYSVKSVEMKKNSDAVVKFNTGKRMLTISTCNTLGAKEDRYILEANFVESYEISAVAETTTATTTVKKTTTATKPTTSTTKPTTQTATTVQTLTPLSQTVTLVKSDPQGRIDLMATITEVGYIDTTTNKFVASSTPSASQKLAFKFIITNIGTKEVEGWSFNAVLPTYPSYIYHSNTQNTLGPSETVEYAITFDKASAGTNKEIIVNVDPTRTIWEISEDNNIVKKQLTIVE